MAVKLFHKTYKHADSSEYIFILHGLFGMLDNWHNMAKKLSVHYNVVIVDQRNHGQSPHTEAMSFEAMAEDLSLLMDDMSIKKAHVIGHSMGGKTVMKFADLHPDKLLKLIVVDIAPRAYKPGHTPYFEAFEKMNFSKFNSRKEADTELAKTEPSLPIRQFLLKNLEKADIGYRLKINLKPIQQFYTTMIDELSFQWPISSETLFIYGEKSNYITKQDQINIEEKFTNVEFVGIPNAGHWVHAEQPIDFHNAVLLFLP